MSKSSEAMILLLVVPQTVEARIGGFHALNLAGQGVICGDAVVVVLASDGSSGHGFTGTDWISE